MSKKVRLPDDSDLPDNTVFGEHAHVATLLVYVDDFLAAGPREENYRHYLPDSLTSGKAVIQTS